MERTTPQSDELALNLAPSPAADGKLTAASEELSAVARGLPARLLDELFHTAQAGHVDLGRDEFEQILLTIGAKHHFGLPPDAELNAHRKESFLRALQLEDLALAQACALGREAAWQQFLARFREPLTQAAISITRSISLGPELADSLYAEIFGLSERDGHRKSPLASYSGRGSLMGWLRTSLAQRHVDHHRRTHRESPLEEDAGFAAADAPLLPLPEELTALTNSIAATLDELPAEDRFLLCAYFLDQHTLQQIAQVMQVHEATVSRKLKRLTTKLRERLIAHLRGGGMNRRAAEEALGLDPRDLNINLRALLQTSATPAFSTYNEEVQIESL